MGYLICVTHKLWKGLDTAIAWKGSTRFDYLDFFQFIYHIILLNKTSNYNNYKNFYL